jgi:hypothetical protein
LNFDQVQPGAVRAEIKLLPQAGYGRALGNCTNYFSTTDVKYRERTLAYFSRQGDGKKAIRWIGMQQDRHCAGGVCQPGQDVALD